MSGIVKNSFTGWGGATSSGATTKIGPSVNYQSFSGAVHASNDTSYTGAAGWQKPVGITMVYIEVVGGGGAGAGSGDGGASDGGAGGGGGAFARQLFAAESLPDTLDIQVGRGGDAPANNVDGPGGGESRVTTPSSFSADASKIILRAFGGGGGAFNSSGGAGGGGGGTAGVGQSVTSTTAGEGGDPTIGGLADTGNVIGGRGGRGGTGNSQGNAHTTGGNSEYGGGGGSCGGAGGYDGPNGDAKGGGGSIYGAGGGGGGGGRSLGDSAAGGLWATYITGTSALVTEADGISRGYGCGDGGGAKGGGRDGGTPGGGGAGSGSHGIDTYYGSGWHGSDGGPGVVRIFSW